MDAGSRLLQSAVPVFLLFVLLEMFVDRRRQTGRYRRGATWSDLATGSVSQVFDLLLKAACLPLYVLLYENARLFELSAQPLWHWFVALLGVDLLYYFWHRAGHEVRLLWAIHAVHHQSEDMNLAVALRQPAFQAPTVVLFFLPLALVGVSPTVVMLSYTINLIYQFFIHTEAVRSLGPLEWVLNTPSHHRVHHGSNLVYLDKNYGGVLIVWDRLFGTFAPEREQVRYGVTKPLASYNPLWANVVELKALVAQTPQVSGVRGFLRLWLGHPAFSLGSEASLAEAAPPHQPKYDTAPRKLAPYVYWQAALLFIALNTAFLELAHAERPVALATVWAAVAVLWSALSLLGWVEQRPWVRASELARVPFIVLGATGSAYALGGTTPAIVVAAASLLLVALPTLWLPPRAGRTPSQRPQPLAASTSPSR